MTDPMSGPHPMSGSDALVAWLGEHLGTAETVDPFWLIAVCEHLSAEEIAAATDRAMALRGMPPAWRELVAAETAANAAVLAGKGADDR